MGSGGPLLNTQTPFKTPKPPYFWLRVHGTPPGGSGKQRNSPLPHVYLATKNANLALSHGHDFHIPTKEEKKIDEHKYEYEYKYPHTDIHIRQGMREV